MKALFIIHCQDPIYGAGRSVGNLIRNLDADVDIVFPVKIKKEGRITPEQIKQFYGPRVRHVWYLPQPARLTVCDPHPGPSQRIKSCVKEMLYWLAKPRYRRLFEQGGYDFIQLNSLTLFPMLDNRWPMFLHVREAALEKPFWWNRSLPKKMEQAHGIIYIAEENRRYCLPRKTPDIVLVNPFDQTGVARVDYQKALGKYRLTGRETVYAIIGNVIETKGVRFVIEAFLQARLDSAVLLVVGQDTLHKSYEKKICEDFGQLTNVRLLGEIVGMDEIYRIVDFVVRGDPVAGAGRTVQEGLYSGAGAIITGSREENLATLDLPAGLDPEERVFFYPIRDKEALVRAFRATSGKKFEQRQYYSNVPEYVKQFTAFVQTHAQDAQNTQERDG